MFAIQLLFIQLFIIGIGAGDRSFECPNDCPLNLYDPICSRGISYSSLCTLKQEICNGKIDKDVYKDIEPCSKFAKDKDTEDAVAIDKNGVILRSFFPDNSKSINENNDDDYNNGPKVSSVSEEN